MVQGSRLCGLKLKPLLIAGPIDRKNPQNAAISGGGFAGRYGPISLHQAEPYSRIRLSVVYECADDSNPLYFLRKYHLSCRFAPSVRFNTVRYLRFRFRVLTASRAATSLRSRRALASNFGATYGCLPRTVPIARRLFPAADVRAAAARPYGEAGASLHVNVGCRQESGPGR
jgi:hypothetical protein